MSPDPRVRRGAHRTSRAASATLLPSLLAILAVASLIAALYVWRGEDAKPPSAAAAPASHSSTSPNPTVSTKATPEKTNEPVANTSSPRAKKHKTSALLRADIAIVVLNQTTRSGLASTVAAALRAKGWTVTGVGNFRGVVSATTVYYPVGHVAAAQAAAKSLPTPARVLPRFGNLSATRLTVVVTTSYPS
jgi:LytR cell envelope-related transcriptional attenuator